MGDTHKHKGVLTSKGTLRSHPISRKHGDRNVLRWHNLALKSSGKTVTKKKSTQQKLETCKVKKVKLSKETIEVQKDEDGYMYVDLTKDINVKGVRVCFQRVEGNKKRTVGLQIEK